MKWWPRTRLDVKRRWTLSSIGDLVGRRLDHPLIGPVFVSWCVWNWPAVVWFLGAVVAPDAAQVGISTHLATASWWQLVFWPLFFGALFAFGAPALYLVYLGWDDIIRDRRLAREALLKGESTIYASEFEHALRKTQELVTHCDHLIASLEEYRYSTGEFQLAVDSQLGAIGVNSAPNMQSARVRVEDAEKKMGESINRLAAFKSSSMDPQNWYSIPAANGWQRFLALTFGVKSGKSE